MCLAETYNSLGNKNLSQMIHIRNGLKQDALKTLIFNFALEYAIRRVQVKRVGFKLNCTHQVFVNADDVNTTEEAYIL